jgi:hypothetical protein
MAAGKLRAGAPFGPLNTAQAEAGEMFARPVAPVVEIAGNDQRGSRVGLLSR